jgi:polar amino acid transport system substrate-binding protein
MGTTSKGMFRWLCVAITLGAFAAGVAHAQQTASTWQQIKQRGELRIGVTPGEPWYFKDPMSGQWSGSATGWGSK